MDFFIKDGSRRIPFLRWRSSEPENVRSMADMWRRNWGGILAAHRIQVISGMARGIDGISQQAALSAGGTSYGVLGCGVDICYPSQNRKIV